MSESVPKRQTVSVKAFWLMVVMHLLLAITVIPSIIMSSTSGSERRYMAELGFGLPEMFGLVPGQLLLGALLAFLKDIRRVGLGILAGLLAGLVLGIGALVVESVIASHTQAPS